MTFEEWWKQMKPAECDEVKLYFEECWAVATAAEREACAGVCENLRVLHENGDPDGDDARDKVLAFVDGRNGK